jgi:hypothetical protein
VPDVISRLVISLNEMIPIDGQAKRLSNPEPLLVVIFDV